MIDLSNETPIGKGTNRLCFIHPKDKDKCIKITHSNDYSETIEELKYYTFLQRKNISWKHISKYYGSIKTSLGKGEVFELVRDYDGKISKMLSYYIYKEKPNVQKEKYLKLLTELKKYTYKENIIIKDLNIKNILLQRVDKNKSKLIIIDGLSHNKLLYFLKYPNNLSLKKIESQWSDFEKKFLTHFN